MNKLNNFQGELLSETKRTVDQCANSHYISSYFTLIFLYQSSTIKNVILELNVIELLLCSDAKITTEACALMSLKCRVYV